MSLSAFGEATEGRRLRRADAGRLADAPAEGGRLRSRRHPEGVRHRGFRAPVPPRIEHGAGLPQRARADDGFDQRANGIPAHAKQAAATVGEPQDHLVPNRAPRASDVSDVSVQDERPLGAVLGEFVPVRLSPTTGKAPVESRRADGRHEYGGGGYYHPRPSPRGQTGAPPRHKFHL